MHDSFVVVQKYTYERILRMVVCTKCNAHLVHSSSRQSYTYLLFLVAATVTRQTEILFGTLTNFFANVVLAARIHMYILRTDSFVCNQPNDNIEINCVVIDIRCDAVRSKLCGVRRICDHTDDFEREAAFGGQRPVPLQTGVRFRYVLFFRLIFKLI